MGGKKEDNERISFYLLLALGMYHGDRNLSPGRGHMVCSSHVHGGGVGSDRIYGAADLVPPTVSRSASYNGGSPRRLAWEHTRVVDEAEG